MPAAGAPKKIESLAMTLLDSYAPQKEHTPKKDNTVSSLHKDNTVSSPHKTTTLPPLVMAPRVPSHFNAGGPAWATQHVAPPSMPSYVGVVQNIGYYNGKPANVFLTHPCSAFTHKKVF
jgi:hypothetical protein